MLVIVNVTKDDTQELDDYEVRINSKVIGRLQHKRSYNGASQLLRDLADSLDDYREEELEELMLSLQPMFERMK